MREGFAGNLEHKYYAHWLHSGQMVTVDSDVGVGSGSWRGRVRGVTHNWGMLSVVELQNGADGQDRETGKMYELQSDENSFDFWKGLIRRKL